VLLTLRDDALHTVLVRRAEPPFAGRWVLPGGFVHVTDTLDAAAARVLDTKVGLRQVFLEQLYTFGALDRDPRARVVSVAYYALVHERLLAAAAGGPGSIHARVVVPWRGERGGKVALHGPDGGRLSTGFDHETIVGVAVQRLRGKIDYAPVGFELLPRDFTLADLQRVHEAVLDRRFNKDSFRRRLLASGQLRATGRREIDVGHRPAELYRFNSKVPSAVLRNRKRTSGSE
jgi:8-oxo-dGTP diphosphatase